jgi:hypothetical protein
MNAFILKSSLCYEPLISLHCITADGAMPIHYKLSPISDETNLLPRNRHSEAFSSRISKPRSARTDGSPIPSWPVHRQRLAPISSFFPSPMSSVTIPYEHTVQDDNFMSSVTVPYEHTVQDDKLMCSSSTIKDSPTSHYLTTVSRCKRRKATTRSTWARQDRTLVHWFKATIRFLTAAPRL